MRFSRLILLFLASITIGFSSSCKDEIKNSGLPVSQEALANDFLVWNKLLQKRGVKVHDENYYPAKNTSNYDLILAYQASFNNAEALEDVLLQVSEGATLISGLRENDDPQTSTLLRELINLDDFGYDKDEVLAEDALIHSAGELDLQEFFAQLGFENDLSPSTVKFKQGLDTTVFDRQWNELSDDEGNTLIAWRNYGAGKIFFFSDMTPLSWRYSQKVMNTLPMYKVEELQTSQALLMQPFLDKLDRSKGEALICRIRYQTQIPRLYEWLIKRGLPLTISLLLLTIFTVWHLAKRFGPLRPVESLQTRRRLGDHLDAVASYHAQNSSRRRQLLQPLLQRSLQLLSRRNPHTPNNKLLENAAKMSKSSVSKIQNLASHSGDSEEDLINSIQLLKDLREK